MIIEEDCRLCEKWRQTEAYLNTKEGELRNLCECKGSGKILTEFGQELKDFIQRIIKEELLNHERIYHGVLD